MVGPNLIRHMRGGGDDGVCDDVEGHLQTEKIHDFLQDELLCVVLKSCRRVLNFLRQDK